MKLLVIASLIALSFTTGFTCSKNTPEAAKTEAPAAQPAATEQQPAAQPSQEQMAQPAAGADGAAAQPAAGEQPAAQPEHK